MPGTGPSDSDKRSEKFLEQAYGLATLEDALAFYDEWAEDYDDQMEQKLGYVAPRVMAETLAKHVQDRNALVLDVGCGTGLTSQYLAKLGFTRLDGIDITPRMIERAYERGIYRGLFEADITRPLDLADATYDAVISSGTFTLGHVGAGPMVEIARVIRPGGHLGCSIHKDVWESKGFKAVFDTLRDQGVLREVEITPGEFFSDHGDTALYCIFRKV